MSQVTCILALCAPNWIFDGPEVCVAPGERADCPMRFGVLLSGEPRPRGLRSALVAKLTAFPRPTLAPKRACGRTTLAASSQRLLLPNWAGGPIPGSCDCEEIITVLRGEELLGSGRWGWPPSPAPTAVVPRATEPEVARAALSLDVGDTCWPSPESTVVLTESFILCPLHPMACSISL